MLTPAGWKHIGRRCFEFLLQKATICRWGCIIILLKGVFAKRLRSSALVVFNNFLLIDATDRSKISCDKKRLFFAVTLYPLSFFANTPFHRNWVFATDSNFPISISLLPDHSCRPLIFKTKNSVKSNNQRFKP